MNLASRNTISLILLFFLTCLFNSIYCEGIQASPINQTIKPRLRAPLTNDLILLGPDFLVHMDFADLHQRSPDIYDDPSGNMAIALYTNETFVNNACDAFDMYNCSRFECHPQFYNTRNISYPYFSVQGYIVRAPLFMDYTYFFNFDIPALYSQNCAGTFSPNQKGMTGVIGMGTEGNGIHNYIFKPPTFSIYLHDDYSQAELSFDCNINKGAQDGTHVALKANNNWEIELSLIRIQTPEVISDIEIIKPSKTIFDINTEFIGLPSRIFDQVIKTLAREFNIKCEADSGSPSRFRCNYTGTIDKLPPLRINEIEVPAKLFLNPISNTSYNLNFVSLSGEDLTTPHQKVSPEFSNHVIFGRSFFKHFYVCFQNKKEFNQIIIYKKTLNQQIDAKSLISYITMGVVIFIPLMCFAVFCIRSLIEKQKVLNIKREFLRSRTNEHALASPLMMNTPSPLFRRSQTSNY